MTRKEILEFIDEYAVYHDSWREGDWIIKNNNIYIGSNGEEYSESEFINGIQHSCYDNDNSWHIIPNINLINTTKIKPTLVKLYCVDKNSELKNLDVIETFNFDEIEIQDCDIHNKIYRIKDILKSIKDISKYINIKPKLSLKIEKIYSNSIYWAINDISLYFDKLIIIPSFPEEINEILDCSKYLKNSTIIDNKKLILVLNNELNKYIVENNINIDNNIWHTITVNDYENSYKEKQIFHKRISEFFR